MKRNGSRPGLSTGLAWCPGVATGSLFSTHSTAAGQVASVRALFGLASRPSFRAAAATIFLLLLAPACKTASSVTATSSSSSGTVIDEHRSETVAGEAHVIVTDHLATGRIERTVTEEIEPASDAGWPRPWIRRTIHEIIEPAHEETVTQSESSFDAGSSFEFHEDAGTSSSATVTEHKESAPSTGCGFSFGLGLGTVGIAAVVVLALLRKFKIL